MCSLKSEAADAVRTIMIENMTNLTVFAFRQHFAFILLAGLSLTSCKEDSFNEISAERGVPKIVLANDQTEAHAYEGQTVHTLVALEAQAGIARVEVMRNGETIESITGVSGQVGMEYVIRYEVPENATVGDQITYSFVLVDREGRQVDRVFTIRIVDAPPIPDFEFEDVTVGGHDYKLINLDINNNVTLSAEHDYLLRGKISLIQGAELRIEPGATIYAESNAALIVSTGTQIVAEGTQEAPIRFTSLSERTGTANRGDWIGLFIHGRAPVTANHPSIMAEFGTYGGTLEDDDSGILRFVEIAYAGAEADPSISNSTARALVNGALNLNGVGRATTLEHIYINKSGVSRTGVSIAGGAARIKHLFVNSPEGRALLTKAGYKGLIQFLAVVYHDSPGGAYTALDIYGDTGGGVPTLSNVSIQGGGESDTRGIRVRNESSSANAPYTGGAKINIYNTWITGTGNPGLRTDSSIDVVFAHGRIFGVGTAFHSSAGAYNTTGAPYFNSTAPVALSGDYKGVETSGAFDPTSVDGWFTAAPYIGAVDPANDWTAGWIVIP